MISRPVDSGAGHFVADQLSNSSYITNIAYTPQDIESMYADIGKLHADGTSKTVPLQVILRETIVSIVRCMDNEQYTEFVGNLRAITILCKGENVTSKRIPKFKQQMIADLSDLNWDPKFGRGNVWNFTSLANVLEPMNYVYAVPQGYHRLRFPWNGGKGTSEKRAKDVQNILRIMFALRFVKYGTWLKIAKLPSDYKLPTHLRAYPYIETEYQKYFYGDKSTHNSQNRNTSTQNSSNAAINSSQQQSRRGVIDFASEHITPEQKRAIAAVDTINYHRGLNNKPLFHLDTSHNSTPKGHSKQFSNYNRNPSGSGTSSYDYTDDYSYYNTNRGVSPTPATPHRLNLNDSTVGQWQTPTKRGPKQSTVDVDINTSVGKQPKPTPIASKDLNKRDNVHNQKCTIYVDANGNKAKDQQESKTDPDDPSTLVTPRQLHTPYYGDAKSVVKRLTQQMQHLKVDHGLFDTPVLIARQQPYHWDQQCGIDMPFNFIPMEEYPSHLSVIELELHKIALSLFPIDHIDGVLKGNKQAIADATKQLHQASAKLLDFYHVQKNQPNPNTADAMAELEAILAQTKIHTSDRNTAFHIFHSMIRPYTMLYVTTWYVLSQVEQLQKFINGDKKFKLPDKAKELIYHIVVFANKYQIAIRKYRSKVCRTFGAINERYCTSQWNGSNARDAVSLYIQKLYQFRNLPSSYSDIEVQLLKVREQTPGRIPVQPPSHPPSTKPAVASKSKPSAKLPSKVPGSSSKSKSKGTVPKNAKKPVAPSVPHKSASPVLLPSAKKKPADASSPKKAPARPARSVPPKGKPKAKPAQPRVAASGNPGNPPDDSDSSDDHKSDDEEPPIPRRFGPNGGGSPPPPGRYRPPPQPPNRPGNPNGNGNGDGNGNGNGGRIIPPAPPRENAPNPRAQLQYNADNNYEAHLRLSQLVKDAQSNFPCKDGFYGHDEKMDKFARQAKATEIIWKLYKWLFEYQGIVDSSYLVPYMITRVTKGEAKLRWLARNQINPNKTVTVQTPEDYFAWFSNEYENPNTWKMQKDRIESYDWNPSIEAENARQLLVPLQLEMIKYTWYISFCPHITEFDKDKTDIDEDLILKNLNDNMHKIPVVSKYIERYRVSPPQSLARMIELCAQIESYHRNLMKMYPPAKQKQLTLPHKRSFTAEVNYIKSKPTSSASSGYNSSKSQTSSKRYNNSKYSKKRFYRKNKRFHKSSKSKHSNFRKSSYSRNDRFSRKNKFKRSNLLIIAQ